VTTELEVERDLSGISWRLADWRRRGKQNK